MSHRIAEFLELDDAARFRKMKGANDYDVCGGINLPWAVMPKQTYSTNFATDSPPERSYVNQDDPDDIDFDSDLEDRP